MARRRSPTLVRLAAAEVVGPLGDAMATVAVILHLQQRGASATTVAAVLVAEAAPTVLAPIAGTVADRVRDRRRLLAVAALAQATLMAAVAIVLPRVPVGVLALLLFARASLDTASAPALGSIVPDVVEDRELERANAMLAGLREVGAVLGPALAGLLFAVTSASWVLAVDAITFVAVAPLFLTLDVPARPAAPAARWRSDATRGVRVVLGTPRLRAVAIGFWIVVFFSAPDDLALAFLGRDTFGGGPVQVGLLLAAASVGLVAVAPFAHAIARRLGAPAASIIAGGLVMTIGNALTALSPVAAAAFAAQVLRGSGIVLLDAMGVRTLVQREVPRDLIGRAFANVYGGVSAAAAAGYVVGGPVLDATSPRTTFGVIAAGGLAGVVGMALLLRRARPSV